jgi:hypothetical protein
MEQVTEDPVMPDGGDQQEDHDDDDSQQEHFMQQAMLNQFTPELNDQTEDEKEQSFKLGTIEVPRLPLGSCDFGYVFYDPQCDFIGNKPSNYLEEVKLDSTTPVGSKPRQLGGATSPVKMSKFANVINKHLPSQIMLVNDVKRTEEMKEFVTQENVRSLKLSETNLKMDDFLALLRANPQLREISLWSSFLDPVEYSSGPNRFGLYNTHDLWLVSPEFRAADVLHNLTSLSLKGNIFNRDSAALQSMIELLRKTPKLQKLSFQLFMHVAPDEKKWQPAVKQAVDTLFDILSTLLDMEVLLVDLNGSTSSKLLESLQDLPSLCILKLKNAGVANTLKYGELMTSSIMSRLQAFELSIHPSHFLIASRSAQNVVAQAMFRSLTSRASRLISLHLEHWQLYSSSLNQLGNYLKSPVCKLQYLSLRFHRFGGVDEDAMGNVFIGLKANKTVTSFRLESNINTVMGDELLNCLAVNKNIECLNFDFYGEFENREEWFKTFFEVTISRQSLVLKRATAIDQALQYLFHQLIQSKYFLLHVLHLEPELSQGDFNFSQVRADLKEIYTLQVLNAFSETGPDKSLEPRNKFYSKVWSRTMLGKKFYDTCKHSAIFDRNVVDQITSFYDATTEYFDSEKALHGEVPLFSSIFGFDSQPSANLELVESGDGMFRKNINSNASGCTLQ